MKKIFLLFLFCGGFIMLEAQISDSTNLKVTNAINLYNGINGRLDRPKALVDIQKYAGASNPKAMNALGLIYLEGKGIQADTVVGIQYLESAGKNGYPQAWHNLAIVYKYGRAGVKQNLAKAYAYMELAAKSNYPIGLYDAGYMLYKGLGCVQSYPKAFDYFMSGAKQNYSPAMYMLGLCYRNGYGVTRNAGEANYWLSAAATKGYRAAANEIALDEPENKINRIKVRGTSTISSPTAFTRIPHLKSVEQKQIDGDYEGVLVTYDWSGKEVISETAFSLTLNSIGNNVEAQWREQGADTIQAKAIWKDSCLLFTEATQGRLDHYSNAAKGTWNFTNASLQLLNDSIGNYLIGNVQMYSPETMEPQRPIYISLRKVVSNNLGIKEHINKFSVYPNPFSEGLNVSFYQATEADVQVLIYNSTGRYVYGTKLGKYTIGQQNITLTLPIPQGVYIFKIIAGENKYQSIIIRK